MKKISFLTGVLVLFTYAGCKKGGTCKIDGYEIVNHQEQVAANATMSVHVDCPAGKKVLGGGFSIETPDYVKVFHSEPSDGHGNTINNGWDVMVHNTDKNVRQTTAIAICAF